MQQMCPNPKCNSPLHTIIVSEDGVQRPVRWCMACSQIADKPLAKRPNVPVAHSSVLRIHAQLAGPWDERKYHRWELFEAVLRNYDADGLDMTQAYRDAKVCPGQWIVAAVPATRRQLARGLLGLPWETCQPPMAVRCNADGSVDLALNAFKVMPRAQVLPGWWELVCGIWYAQCYDRH